MLESVVFFEPYRAVLQALQDFTYDTFPMLDYFIGWEKDPKPPAYLERASEFVVVVAGRDLPQPICDPMEYSAWPKAEELGLDHKQHQALFTALTSRLSLIQGPPGTGKTFLALKILDALLHNKSLWQGKIENRDLMFSMRASLKTGNSNDWHWKNKCLWKSHGSLWKDGRCPILVICLTVTVPILESLLKHSI